MSKQLAAKLRAKREYEAKAAQFARNQYATDDVEIDDAPKFSHAEGEGIWVSAWVWVSDADLEDDDE